MWITAYVVFGYWAVLFMFNYIAEQARVRGEDPEQPEPEMVMMAYIMWPAVVLGMLYIEWRDNRKR